MTNLVLRGSWIFDMRTDLLHYSMCFTSLFLYLLIMLTRQIKCVSICSRESVEMVEKIAVELSKVDNDCMLYTPTVAVADYENCSRSTLACYALELNVLFVEIQSVAKLSQKLLRLLNKLKYKLQDKMKSCPECELYQEQRAGTFLEELQNFLQMMNAGKSCAPRTVKRHLENLMEKNMKNMI
ncbi:interleukin 15, like isoform X2 [Rhinichthys klamathensis goyatoka]|uniref:interleukin 15, like isoform X2 n=1 Tax=Rhinichthys klamathensis goyatoka TaxID=3034132 RepID=UPI0024B5C8DC|nr:interleukin 15, like isoform X2 [Rhinichthys klamathensis goyatoka]